MTNAKVTIKNTLGLHARPAGVFSKCAASYKQCQISVKKDGKLYNAKSVLNILTANIKCGDEIEIIAEGQEEERAIAGLVEAVQLGLGES